MKMTTFHWCFFCFLICLFIIYIISFIYLFHLWCVYIFCIGRIIVNKDPVCDGILYSLKLSGFTFSYIRLTPSFVVYFAYLCFSYLSNNLLIISYLYICLSIFILLFFILFIFIFYLFIFSFIYFILFLLFCWGFVVYFHWNSRCGDFFSFFLSPSFIKQNTLPVPQRGVPQGHEPRTGNGHPSPTPLPRLAHIPTRSPMLASTHAHLRRTLFVSSE